MSMYQVGSLCEDCYSYGLRNYLKPFYINLDEQIIKCESLRCMFPYLTKPTCKASTDSKPMPNLLLDSKPSDSILNLDEFIEQQAKQIDVTSAKLEQKPCITKVEDMPIMFDFSSLFTDNPVKAEDKKISISWKTEDVKSTSIIKNEAISLPKARISRCLSNIRSKSSSKKQNLKRSKLARGPNGTVFVIEPESGKSMRPLDLIMHYIKGRDSSR